MKTIKNIMTLALLALATIVGNQAQAQCDDGNYNCYLVVTGQDGYGDGWNGNTISFSQNGTAIGSYTIDNGAEYTDTIRICTDNGPVSCSWTQGSYAYETSFTIADSMGAILYSCSDGSTLNGQFATLDPCPACPSVTGFNVSNLTSSTATVSWTEPGSATTWYYQYGTSPVPGDNWQLTYDNSATLTGLNANTLYYFFVYTECSADDISMTVYVTFRTACGTMTLPINEGFENNGTNMPFCWQIFEACNYSYYGTPTPMPQVQYDSYGTYYGHNGNGALSLGANTTKGSGIMSPKMPVLANQLEVSFWMRGEDAVQVGYVTTNDTTNAVFHLVGTVGPSSYVDYSYSLIQGSVSFDTVTTTDSVWIVFRRAPGVVSDLLYIDDITIRQSTGCSDPTGLEVVAGEMGSGQITLNWDTVGGSAWEVAYGPVGFDPENTTSIVSATTAPYTVTDLNDSLNYDFYLRQVCGSATSYWVGPVSGRPNLFVASNAVDTVNSCGFNLVDNGGIGGNFLPNTNQIIVLMPESDDQTIRIQGYAHIYSGYASYEMYQNHMRVFAGTDTNGMLLRDINSENVDNVDIVSETGPMTIWFKSSTFSDDCDEGFLFYVSCTEMGDCTTPYNLNVTNIGGTSATVSWEYSTALGDATGFTLYVTDMTTDYTEEYELSGEDRSYVLTDLTERTNYSVRLAVDCEGIDTIGTSFATVCILGGEVQIGEGTATTSYLPAPSFYYSIGQQIFTSADLYGIDQIYGIKLYCTTSGTVVRDWDIYMDTTSIASYGSINDYVTPDSSSLLFSGHVEMHQGWVEVLFDSSFLVPANKNVTLTVYESTGDYNTSTLHATNTSSPMSLYGYGYYAGDVDPLADNPFATLEYYNYNVQSMRNTIKFLTPCASTDCMPPYLTVVDPDTAGVHLEWVPLGGESSWMVEYRTPDTNVWTLVATDITDTSYFITGLVPATTYLVRVSSLCSDDTVGATATVVTPCAGMPLPFTEGFENFNAPSNLDETQMCWFRSSEYNNMGYGSFYPYVYDYNSYAHTGSKSMYFYNYAGNVRLALPMMAAPVNTLTLEFYAMFPYAYYGNPSVEVGVCTEPTDTTTYTVLGSYMLDGGEMEYTFFSIDLDSYTGPNGHIFIRSALDNEASFYLDDISVNAIPSCRRVTAASVADLTDTSATLNIVDSYNRTSYTVLLGTSDSIQNATDSLTVGTNTVILGNLDPSTTYRVWVRANCSATDQSTFKAVPPFTTLCSKVVVNDTVSFYDDLDDGNMDCMWQITDSLNEAWNCATADYSGPHPYSGGYMLTFGGASNGQSMVVMPTFDFSELTTNAEFSFYHYQYTEHTYSDYWAVPLSVYYRIGDAQEWTLLSNVDTTVSNVWKKRVYELPSSQGAAQYQVAIKAHSNGNYYAIGVDDISVRPLSGCITPHDVTVSDITDRTASIHWTGTSAAYKVQYRLQGSWNWNARTVEDVDSCVITPLDMASAYEVRVLAICGAFEQSEPSEVINFTTEFCTNRIDALNYEDTATDASTLQLMDVNTMYSYSEVLVESSVLAGMGDINGVSFYVDNRHNVTSIPNCQIYIGHTSVNALNAFQNDTNYTLAFNGNVPIVNGWNSILFSTPFEWDGSSNVVVGFAITNNNYGYDSVLYGAHVAATNHFAAVHSTSNYFTPDQANLMPAINKSFSTTVPDIKLTGCSPTCYEPVVSRVATTESTIEIEWYNEGATVALYLKQASAADWGDSVVLTDNSYTFTGLLGMTDYDIRLHRVCTDEGIGYSEWVYLTSHTDTACSIPYDLHVTAVDNNSATFAWTDGPMTGGSWELHVWGSGIDNYYTVSTNPATIDGLVSGGNYHAAVRAYCGSDDHVVGEYSEELAFDNICQPVTNLQAAVNGSSVVLTWDGGEHNAQWLVAYGYYGFAPNDMLGYQIVSTPTATIHFDGSQLPGAKGSELVSYAFRVRALCDDDWNSVWSDDAYASVQDIDGVDIDATRLTLQPNPATDRVMLHFGDYDNDATVSIIGIDGRLMGYYTSTDSDMSLDVSQLAAGTYFVKVQTSSWSAVRKLVVR